MVKRKHKELKSSFLNVECLFQMVNDNDRNEGKKQKIECDLSLSYYISASIFEINSRHGDGSGTEQFLAKMSTKLFLERTQKKLNRRGELSEVKYHLKKRLIFIF